jgi:hypothetical protein
VLRPACGWAGALLLTASGLVSGAQVRIAIVDSTTETSAPCRIHLKANAD